VESDGVFSSWMRENELGAVIVRPDRYVFAGASNADQLNMLIGTLIEALGGR
jgi:3-(3-hydroxy-phenyl)propionate hydroxylase